MEAETPFIAFPPSFGSLQPEEKLSPRPLLQFPLTETSEDVMEKGFQHRPIIRSSYDQRNVGKKKH